MLEVAEILRFLSIREIRGHLEHFGADHKASSEGLVVASLRLALVTLDPLGVAVDERGAPHGGIGARLQHLDVVPLAQLLADAAFSVARGLVFVPERDGRLVGAGHVAHLCLVPPRRLVHGSELGPFCAVQRDRSWATRPKHRPCRLCVIEGRSPGTPPPLLTSNPFGTQRYPYRCPDIKPDERGRYTHEVGTVGTASMASFVQACCTPLKPGRSALRKVPTQVLSVV